MKKGLRILRIKGIDVYLHYSWWIIFALLAYSLALDFFPSAYPGLSGVMYWLMGGLAALSLFVSVLLHELSHSFVAKARKIKVESITLFFFGGVASLPSEDIQPTTEFWMALAGPLFSLVFAGVLYLVHQLALPLLWEAVTAYLWQINLILGLFNLVPGFPLDGGRVFRALLMFYYHDIRKATRIASRGGRFFGGLLVFLGFLNLLGGNFAGLWSVFLGGFLWMIAKSSYEQVLIKEVLAKIPVHEVMVKKYLSVQQGDRFDKVLRLYKENADDIFIVRNKRTFVGIVDMRMVRTLSEKLRVVEVMIPAKDIEVLSVKENTYDALRKFETQGLSVLPVVEKSIKGVVTMNKVVHRLALEMKN